MDTGFFGVVMMKVSSFWAEGDTLTFVMIIKTYVKIRQNFMALRANRIYLSPYRTLISTESQLEIHTITGFLFLQVVENAEKRPITISYQTSRHVS